MVTGLIQASRHNSSVHSYSQRMVNGALESEVQNWIFICLAGMNTKCHSKVTYKAHTQQKSSRVRQSNSSVTLTLWLLNQSAKLFKLWFLDLKDTAHTPEDWVCKTCVEMWLITSTIFFKITCHYLKKLLVERTQIRTISHDLISICKH